VIAKIREGPNKLKAQAKGFLKVLRKHGVSLDGDANPVLDHIGDANIRNYLRRKEALVRVTLMQADLEFEYPQKLEKLLVKADMLRWLDEEEEKLKNIALEEFLESEAQQKAAVKLTPGEEFHLTLDDYYGNKDMVSENRASMKIGAGGMIEKQLTWAEYEAAHKTDRIFDNDVLEQQYKFWETSLEKEQRLKKVWIDMNRRKALGGVDRVTLEEQHELDEQIVALTRKVRWQVDQELVRRNHRPLFHQNYVDKYEKEEFLADADLEFFKVKKLLEKNPRLLREDPVLSIDYHKIITLIRQKKMNERSSDHFDPANAFHALWQDPGSVERNKQARVKKIVDKYERLNRLGLEETSSPSEAERLEMMNEDEEKAYSLKSTKKQEAKQRKAIISQFDKIATAFASQRKSLVGKDSTIKARDGSEVAETAGMIKKAARDKTKKEKTLGAKLRLKTKKPKESSAN